MNTPLGDILSLAVPAEVKAAACAIAVSYGEDPDDWASLMDVCGPRNEPLPNWQKYIEQAEAVLSVLPTPSETPPTAVYQRALAAQSRKLQAVLHIPGVKEALAREFAPTPPAAEAPGQEPVAVKPLEWEEPSRKSNGCWTAQSPFGTYSVVNEGGWYASRDEAPRDFYFEWSGQDMSRDTLYTAQAAAQADYEQRIRSALVSAPPTYADAEAKGRVAEAIFNAWAEHEGWDGTWSEIVKAAAEPVRYPKFARLYDLALLEAEAAIRSLASPAPKEPGQ